MSSSDSINNSILGINTQDSIINDIFKYDVQYTHITGDVNLCVNRCGQEIEGCEEVNFMNMTNYGKILTLNVDMEKNKNAKCNIRKAYDNDSKDEDGFSSYKFEKMFVMTPSFHKIDNILYDCEFGFVFSKFDKYQKKVYMILCVLASNAVDPRPETLNKSGDLLFYKLTDALFGNNENIPQFSNKKEINSPPNPVQLSDFMPPVGERSFYEYSYAHAKNISYRIFQRPMMISPKVLENLRQKLTPNQLFNQYKQALQTYENDKLGLLIFYKEDTQKSQKSQNEKEKDDIQEEEFIHSSSKKIESFNTIDSSSKKNNDEDDNDEDNKDDNEDDKDNEDNEDDEDDKDNEDDNKNNHDNIKKNDSKRINVLESEHKKNVIIENLESNESEAEPPKKKNSSLLIYIISIFVILLQIILNLLVSFIFNKPITGYKVTPEIIQFLLNKDATNTKYYFISKILNIGSIFISIIFFLFTVFIGAAHDFSDKQLTNESKGFLSMNIMVLVFNIFSFISLLAQRYFRLQLTKDKFSEISSIDQFFEIESIYHYLMTKNNISEDCIKDDLFKLSYENENIMTGGDPNSNYSKPILGTNNDSNFMDNLQSGLVSNLENPMTFGFTIFIFIMYIFVFSESISKLDYGLYNLKMIKGIKNTYIVLYSLMMLFIYGILLGGSFYIPIVTDAEFTIQGFLEKQFNKVASIFVLCLMITLFTTGETQLASLIITVLSALYMLFINFQNKIIPSMISIVIASIIGFIFYSKQYINSLPIVTMIILYLIGGLGLIYSVIFDKDNRLRNIAFFVIGIIFVIVPFVIKKDGGKTKQKRKLNSSIIIRIITPIIMSILGIICILLFYKVYKAIEEAKKKVSEAQSGSLEEKLKGLVSEENKETVSNENLSQLRGLLGSISLNSNEENNLNNGTELGTVAQFVMNKFNEEATGTEPNKV